jgi:hypothetical protein
VRPQRSTVRHFIQNGTLILLKRQTLRRLRLAFASSNIDGTDLASIVSIGEPCSSCRQIAPDAEKLFQPARMAK